MLRTNLVTESNNGTSYSCSKLLKGLARTYPILQCVACCPGYLNLEIAVEYRIYSINRPGRLLNFWILRMGAYSRWALIRGWSLTRINTVLQESIISIMRVVNQFLPIRSTLLSCSTPSI